MSNEIMPQNNNKNPISTHIEWTKDQIELIKTTVAKGTTDSQLQLFLYTCKRTGLDPLAKQIHCVVRHTKRGPEMAIQTAIDGYRLIADRSEKYAGNDDPIFDKEDNPTKATVTVYKMVDGVRCAFTATARWDQYYPGEIQGFMWKKMPHLMLGKCAEALALRKAFPAELSGVYTNEEMEQVEVMDSHPALSKTVPLPSLTSESVIETDVKVDTQSNVISESNDTEELEANGTNVLKGLISAYFPPKGKGPHKFNIGGEYCQTFDQEIADKLVQNKQQENEVMVSVHKSKSTNKKTGQVYENLEIDSISPLGEPEL